MTDRRVSSLRRWLGALALAVAAFLAGGYVFRDVQSRSFLELHECGDDCYRANELAGLIASAGIQRVPGLLPLVLKETSGCITIRHPFPQARRHFVVFPKRDIRDIGSVSVEDGPVMLECLAHVGWLVERYGLRNYWVETNGPGRQHVTYLHLHVLSNDARR